MDPAPTGVPAVEQPGSLYPWVAAAGALAFVPAAVAFFIYVQLFIIVRKGSETDLTDKLPVYFGGDGACFLVVGEPRGGRLDGCVGLKTRTGGQAELVYFAVRPGVPDPPGIADALLDAAISHARQSSFSEVVVKLNSAEAGLVNAVKVAGFGDQQLVRINAWFHAYRMILKLRRGR
ncbi:hypothetical protein GPECTOR_8g177 [Gonium pectorale]|uniref:N-acetyltransferase domain-containing protein n=1 Tax=Gonium pectorale TaxID=33097 RepID=A0A150GSD0_GONPE|nr:hypothetical protein GPECTOR_8g177 [Gonium pectorale]|eukprot:KXZ52789.1 hypothetical protein GPECTOR_8g177 [Gonium pectorale]